MPGALADLAGIFISCRVTGHGGFAAVNRSGHDRVEGLGEVFALRVCRRGAGVRCSQAMVTAARMASPARAMRARPASPPAP